jgi:hypothetical protein
MIVLFTVKEIGKKAAYKILVKLTKGERIDQNEETVLFSPGLLFTSSTPSLHDFI